MNGESHEDDGDDPVQAPQTCDVEHVDQRGEQTQLDAEAYEPGKRGIRSPGGQPWYRRMAASVARRYWYSTLILPQLDCWTGVGHFT
jgi:hypothetical protein